MSENGQVAVEVAEQAIQAVTESPRRYRLDPDELTPKDMKRARVMLGGKNPWELMEDDDEKLTLIIWCLKSRAQPDLTWAQAEETPFSEFDPAVPRDPPPTRPLEQSGSSGSTPSGSGSTRRRPKPAAAPSSASSSG
jgi:hypothetical protein